MNKASFALLGLLAFGSAAGADDYLPLRVRIPEDFDAGRALVLVGQYGNGLSLGRADRETGSNDFTCRIAPTTTSAKLLIYYPGCSLVTADIRRDKILQPLTAVLQRLPEVRIAIKCTRSDGTPISGQSVSLRQPLLEMEYFHYLDGMVFWPYASPVASATAGASGRVSFEAPLLLDDPLFAKLKRQPGFDVSLSGNLPAGLAGYDLLPAWIPAQKSYAAPVVVKVVYRGRISGKVERSYLISHDLDVPMGPDANNEYRVWFNVHQVGSRGSSGTGVKADGSFSVPLPAGTYDFTIEVTGGARSSVPRKVIPVEENVVVGEQEDRQIVLK